MTDRTWRPPAAEVVARARRHYERRLSSEEARDLLAIPLSAAEREEKVALIRWFRGRYPDPLARSAYVRRAYRRWTDTAPAAGESSR